MLDQLTAKELTSISRFSYILQAPLLAAALFVELGLWLRIAFEELFGKSFSPDSALYALESLVYFGVSVFIVWMGVLLVQAKLSQYATCNLLVALSMLTFGLLGIAPALEVGDYALDNKFWHLAAFAWGMNVLSDERNNNRVNSDAATRHTG